MNVSNRNVADEFEILLSHPAIGTLPVIGNILPAGAGRDPILGPTIGLIIDEATDNASPPAHESPFLKCPLTAEPREGDSATRHGERLRPQSCYPLRSITTPFAEFVHVARLAPGTDPPPQTGRPAVRLVERRGLPCPPPDGRRAGRFPGRGSAAGAPAGTPGRGRSTGPGRWPAIVGTRGTAAHGGCTAGVRSHGRRSAGIQCRRGTPGEPRQSQSRSAAVQRPAHPA